MNSCGKIQVRINNKIIYFIILFFIIVIETNPTFKANTSLRYTIIIADCLYAAFYCLIIKKTIRIHAYVIWAIITFAFFRSSALWSINSQDSIQQCKNLLIILLITAVTFIMVEDSSDFKSLWYSILLAFIFNAFYVITVVGLGNIGEYRIGVDYDGLQLWNANSIGAFTGFGCVMLLFMFTQKKGLISRIIIVVLTMFMLFMSLNTGSRKSLIVIIGVFILYLYLINPGVKRIRNVLIIFLAIVFIWWLIMNNAKLYEIIGARMIRMFDELNGQHTTEHSMSERMYLITSGMQYFMKKPFWGYGIDGFRDLTFYHTYAHNNYVELLVGVGLIGTIIYYYIYVHEIRKSIGPTFKDRDPIAVFLFSLIVVVLINHMAIVSYTDTAYNIIFMLFGIYIDLYSANMITKESE